ncbi:MAG: UDP-N-acetylmuramate dehydrogenase [Clostridia bacterium]|nr:UDP-N-acetylmuramate dehydrogenase [Clostridia bacterium]
MDLKKIAKSLQSQVKGKIKILEALSRHTTWQIGGPADLFLIPVDRSDLENAVKFCNLENIPVTIIGGGSNLLISDQGVRGLVIKLAGGLKKWEINGVEVRAESGVRLPFLVRQTVNEGLQGLEFAGGIPGTVGGAVIMNAGAHGGSMNQVVERVVAMDKKGQLKYFTNEELGFSYRSSNLKHRDDLIVLEVSFKLTQGNREELEAALKRYLLSRQEKQPWQFPNAGSVFKNPPGYSAGWLIESVGAKGWQVGKAQVSTKHANFIVNLGGATCQDVLTLIEKIQKTVKEKYDIDLEPEIITVGG